MNLAIEVFKTNVPTKKIALKVSDRLLAYQPEFKINFDLEDCDNILRIESPSTINIGEICKLCNDLNIILEVLPD